MYSILFISHFWGDYILQNDWMAANKAKATLQGYIACFMHVVMYCIPFSFICNLNSLLVIAISHFIIDKYSLAKYLVRCTNWNFKGDGFSENKPIWLRVWLMIIIDNTLHITCNWIAVFLLQPNCK
jgi:hypothetical protein